MSRILIAGAGQCGLQLALGLQAGGADVTLVSARSAAELTTIMSTQVLFGPTLALERAAGLDFWQHTAPPIAGLEFCMVAGGQRVAGWSGDLDIPAMSVDQRTKFAAWQGLFLERGGDLRIQPLDPSVVDDLAPGYDLVVIATDRDGLAGMFRTRQRGTPRRSLAAVYLSGAVRAPRGRFTLLPGLGEIVEIDALSGAPGAERPCRIVLVEAIPDGPLDAFADITGPVERLDRMLALLRDHLPEDRYPDVELTDPGATLVGKISPALRDPVALLPSGRPVLGAGDAIAKIDPLGAQGANSAAHCADSYLRKIIACTGPFDQDWMRATGTAWLDTVAAPAVAWTEAILEPPAHLRGLLAAAQANPTLAHTLTNLFAQPARVPEVLAEYPLTA